MLAEDVGQRDNVFVEVTDSCGVQVQRAERLICCEQSDAQDAVESELGRARTEPWPPLVRRGVLDDERVLRPDRLQAGPFAELCLQTVGIVDHGVCCRRRLDRLVLDAVNPGMVDIQRRLGVRCDPGERVLDIGLGEQVKGHFGESSSDVLHLDLQRLCGTVTPRPSVRDPSSSPGPQSSPKRSFSLQTGFRQGHPKGMKLNKTSPGSSSRASPMNRWTPTANNSPAGALNAISSQPASANQPRTCGVKSGARRERVQMIV